MKLVNFFIVAVFISLFVGCSSTTPNVAKKNSSYTPDMTSTQVEAQMKWRYCEESK